ncbi:uncharacterized protein BDZ83DRAFT_605332 [Colletotrichum acutatum]|uniref:Secreted protein n=1 Tax=Glomerella acutata TaxID=27357 RepID=A0AAD8XLG7_GLOAC|nr:uncharacterized protein BDZ83DRAFT_605332 [Colletotrichum acutatum]KAK1729498.1 hypothetical protein BDZ83DRAFT_605332 [Colletotrichum acutatum]
MPGLCHGRPMLRTSLSCSMLSSVLGSPGGNATAMASVSCVSHMNGLATRQSSPPRFHRRPPWFCAIRLFQADHLSPRHRLLLPTRASSTEQLPRHTRPRIVYSAPRQR